jgi:hypothetical protein
MRHLLPRSDGSLYLSKETVRRTAVDGLSGSCSKPIIATWISQVPLDCVEGGDILRLIVGRVRESGW